MTPTAEGRKNRGTRKVFIRGKLEPRPTPRPCHDDFHAGPLLNTAKYEAFADTHGPESAIWRGYGECARCSSTIHVSQLRRAS